MKRCAVPLLLTALLVVGGTVFVLVRGPQASAEHANIELTLASATAQAVAFSDQEPPPGGRNKRPVLEAIPGQLLVFQFFLTNVYPHGRLKDVTVRYFVRPFSTAGKSADRALSLPEGSMTLEFKPRCRVGARVRFRAPPPGRYLARVQTEHTQSDHEHFSAIELHVKTGDGGKH